MISSHHKKKQPKDDPTMNVARSNNHHQLCRISAAAAEAVAVVEEGQEIQLQSSSWKQQQHRCRHLNETTQHDYFDDGYNNGEGTGGYCFYYHHSDSGNSTFDKHPPSSSESVFTGATISTATSSSLSSTSSRLSPSSSLPFFSSVSVPSSPLPPSNKAATIINRLHHQKEQGEEGFSDEEQDDERCPVTGHYSNIHDHYYIPKATTSSSWIKRGQYGKVQSCIHMQSGNTYAVKSIRKSQIDRLDHLRREIYLLTQVSHHPYILQLVDYHEDEDHVHIITDKYTGGELFDVIVANTTMEGCLDEECAASIIKCLLGAVAYLHGKNIVHRDIKPENILFQRRYDDDDDDHHQASSSSFNNSIRLIDFGLSRKHNPQVDGYMSHPVGTSYYMSPEVLKGKYTGSCDIWSVGIITYILLCGYPPFNGANDHEIKRTIMQYGDANYVNFKLRGWAGKSEEAKDFIMCLLRRDPRTRFTAKEALMHPWLKIHDS